MSDVNRMLKARMDGAKIDNKPSGTMSNTDKILNAKAEKDRLSDFDRSINVARDNDKQDKSPVYINNSTVVAAKSAEDSKTKRVFTDDNTFSRLSSYDAHHPNYNGFRT